MNKLERQLLAAGLTVFKPYIRRYERIKKRCTKEERLIWFNEKAKHYGYKVFTVQEMEFFTRKDKRTIRKIIRKMVGKGVIR